MVKKYIVDSVTYWADEYHIDGFRFDLVGLIDTETMNAVVEEVHKTHPNVIFYGEGWTMNTSVTKDGYTMATQKNSTQTPGFAYFSDTIRDAIRGPMGDDSKSGYAAGTGGYSGTITNCFMASPNWCKSPTQSINYASCHDNLALFDKITMSTRNLTVEERVKINNLAAAIVMTSQGTPLFQAGEEILRSKPKGDGTFDHNSYKSSDAVNSIKWNNLNDPMYADTYEYYKGLIAFRKAHPALRMTSAEAVEQNITIMRDLESNVNGYHIAGGEIDDDMIVIFNPRKEGTSVTLPEGKWDIYIDGENSGTTVLRTADGSVSVDARSAMVLVKQAPPAPAPVVEEPFDMGFLIPVLAAVILAGIAVVVVLKKRKA
jgi:pullulanase